MTAGKARVFVLFLSVFWCAVQIMVPGRFPQGDEAIFKEPGYQLSINRAMAAPPFKGFFSLSPDISETFAIYQPLYSAGYAGWLKLFPHTFRSAVAYDAVIHLALVVTMMFALPQVVHGLRGDRAAAVAGVYNFMGTVARPDGLAMVFGYAGLALWLTHDPGWKRGWSGVLGGVLLGLCVATSLPAAGILLVWAGLLWLSMALKGAVDTRRTVVVFLAAGFTAVLILAPFYAREGALAQYRQHARWFAFAGLVGSWRAGSPEPFIDLVIAGFHTNIYMYPMMGLLVLSGVLVHASTSRVAGGVSAVKHVPVAFVAAVVVCVSVFLCLPQQVYYYWFIVPVLIASLIAGVRTRPVLLLVLAATAIIGGNRTCRDFVKTCALPPGQSIAAAEKALTANVPTDARLVVNPASYFAARRFYPQLCVKRQEMPDILAEAEYCAWSSWWLRDVDGMMVPAGMLSPRDVRTLKSEFTRIHDSLPSEPPRFAGIPLGGEPRGFGMVIYKRTAGLERP